ncbi:MAG: hypothetical protein IT569_05360 [Leptospiraceae bacterium]|nr:hypothetical protein [Leptospiraceae bacterium]
MEYFPLVVAAIGFLVNAVMLVYGLKYQVDKTNLMVNNLSDKVDKLSKAIDNHGNFNIDDHKNFSKKILEHSGLFKKHGERIHKLEVHTNIKNEK